MNAIENLYKTGSKPSGKFFLSYIQQAACLSDKETEIVENSLVTEIIINTAFLSGCIDPDRVIIANLCTFIAAFRCREIFNHRDGDTLKRRLSTINFYPGGDFDIIKAGILLLELLSLNDHRHDFEEDLAEGKANPLITNLDFETEKVRIENEYTNLPDEIKKSFKWLHDKAIKTWFWA